MAETTYNRANNQQSISGNKGSRPKANTAFSDLPMSSLIPAGTAQQNVTGIPASPPTAQRGFSVQGTPTEDAAALTAQAGAVELGTPEWEQMQLTKAIENLRVQYSQAAAQAGGNMSDPYWKSEYDKAVEKALTEIRTESANNRQVTEEAQKGRDFTAEQNAQQQVAERKLARESRNAQENSAMFGALGKGGMDFLTTPTGGKEAKLLGFDPVTSKAIYSGEDVAGTTPLGSAWESLKGGLKTPAPVSVFSPSRVAPVDYNKLAFDPSAAPEAAKPFSMTDPVAKNMATNGATFKNYLAPSVLGTGIGMALPGKNKGNAGLQALAGFAGSGVNSAFGGGGKTPGWSNLISSAGAAWANPFNKGSWGKKTGGTVAKLIGTGLATRGLPAAWNYLKGLF